jgi:hypothetical protein
MGKICVISKGKDKVIKGGEVHLKRVCDEEVVYLKLLGGGRRYLRRTLLKEKVDRAVKDGEIPLFAEEELERAGIKIFDGKSIMPLALPLFLSRAAKMDRENDKCTVYDENADHKTIEIIEMAGERFRFVSFCSKSANAKNLAAKLMADTGIALKLGEYRSGVAIVVAGEGGEQKTKINLNNFNDALFVDHHKNKLTPALAEAIVGIDATADMIKEKKLKVLIQALDKDGKMY